MLRVSTAAVLALALAAASAHAAPLQQPGGGYVESVCKTFVCQLDNDYYDTPSRYGRHSVDGASGGGVTTFSPGPDVSLSASAVSHDVGAEVHAAADITYYFRYTARDLDAAAALDAYRQQLIDGGVLCGSRVCTRADQAPIVSISGYYSLAATPGEAVTSMVVGGSQYQTFQRACSGVGARAASCDSGNWAILGSLTKVSALDYDGWLHLSTDADLPENTIACGASCLGQASAWIDPLISLRSDFADAGAFTLQLDSGFANGSAPPTTPGGAPEPGTWALAVLGFGLAGSAMRRRPRHSAGARA